VSRDGGKTWTREYTLDKYDAAMEEEMETLRKAVNVFCEVCDKVMLVDDLKRHTHEEDEHDEECTCNACEDEFTDAGEKAMK
jgi:RNase P subunit RPR2